MRQRERCKKNDNSDIASLEVEKSGKSCFATGPSCKAISPSPIGGRRIESVSSSSKQKQERRRFKVNTTTPAQIHLSAMEMKKDGRITSWSNDEDETMAYRPSLKKQHGHGDNINKWLVRIKPLKPML